METETSQIVPALNGPWGPVFYRDEVDSTNLWAKRLAEAGTRGPQVFMAGRQLNGRGRLGRHWHSPPGKSLYLSMLIELNALPLSRAPMLTLAIALAAQGAMKDFGASDVALKWPNDIVVEDTSGTAPSLKKLGGVLASVVTTQGLNPQVVLGLGLNLSHVHGDLPNDLHGIATSLYLLTGKQVTDLDIAVNILERVHALMEQLVSGDVEVFLTVYRGACLTLGRAVAFERDGGIVEGRAVGIDSAASLIVEGHDARRHVITAGDVRVRGLEKHH